VKVTYTIPRNRKTPGRVLQSVSLSFVLNWPSGSASGSDASYQKNLKAILRRILHELERIPLAERSMATARLTVSVRKRGGGALQVQLASWSGSRPVEAFFQEARAAWRKLPKENDDHQKIIVDEREKT